MRDFRVKDKDDNNVLKAHYYALKLLSYRGRSEKEIEERLKKKGFSQSTILHTLDTLKAKGFLNDMALAENLKREAITNKMLSNNGAKLYLLKRGIPINIIENMFIHDENTDISNAERLIDKKMKSLKHYPEITVKRRLYNFLMRRGYSLETIRTVLKDKKYSEEDEL